MHFQGSLKLYIFDGFFVCKTWLSLTCSENFSSGHVFVVESFSELVAQDFNVVVFARYNQLSNYAVLSISLHDETNNPPKFMESEYSAKVLSR